MKIQIQYDYNGVPLRHPAWKEEDYNKFLARWRPAVEKGKAENITYKMLIEHRIARPPRPKLKWYKRSNTYSVTPEAIKQAIIDLQKAKIPLCRTYVAMEVGCSTYTLKRLCNRYEISLPHGQPNKKYAFFTLNKQRASRRQETHPQCPPAKE